MDNGCNKFEIDETKIYLYKLNQNKKKQILQATHTQLKNEILMIDATTKHGYCGCTKNLSNFVKLNTLKNSIQYPFLH